MDEHYDAALRRWHSAPIDHHDTMSIAGLYRRALHRCRDRLAFLIKTYTTAAGAWDRVSADRIMALSKAEAQAAAMRALLMRMVDEEFAETGSYWLVEIGEVARTDAGREMLERLRRAEARADSYQSDWMEAKHEYGIAIKAANRTCLELEAEAKADRAAMEKVAALIKVWWLWPASAAKRDEALAALEERLGQ